MGARLTKRGNIWFARIAQPGGGTRRVSTHCTDKKAAEKRANELEREAFDPANAAANKATTAEACAEFIGSRQRRGRAAGTLHHYGVKLGHTVRLMPRLLAGIDAHACERFIETRMEEGAAQTTVKKEIRALGAMLRHARRQGLYQRDVEAVIPELEETYKPRERFLTPLELVGLVSALPSHRAAQVVFIVATGARFGESERARDEDIDGMMVLLRGTKTEGSWRTVPVPPTMRIALGWARAHARSLPTLGPGPMFEAWGNVRHDLTRACRQIGIATVSPNDLRRTFATWLRMAGVSTDLIGKALGHTTSRMAERVYGRISPTDLGRLIEGHVPSLSWDGSPVGQRGGNLMLPAAASDVPETAKTPAKPQCPGTESNRRHGDFQLPESGSKRGKSPSFGDEWVTGGLTFRARARRWLTREAA